MLRTILSLSIALCLLGCAENVATQSAGGASAKKGDLQTVATFNGAMPTGVTVSSAGRIFVNFPKWEDPVEYSVAEIVNGQPKPYPNAEINRYDEKRLKETLGSVQSVVVDPADRLWILDTGSVDMKPIAPGGAKL